MAEFYERWSRVPTYQERMEFDGEPSESADRYAEAMRTGWRCPSCRRTAQECIRWTRISDLSWRVAYRDEFFMGFTMNLRMHTCPAEEFGYLGQRFAPTLLCSDCKQIDQNTKRKLRLPLAFSFSPAELGQFMFCLPYSGYSEIDYEVAHKFYAQGGAAFFGSVEFDPHVLLTSVSRPPKRPTRLPSVAELQTFDGSRFCKEYPEAVRRDWRCPCCHRTAQECVRWGRIQHPRTREKYGDAYGEGLTVRLDLHHCHGDGMDSLTWRRFHKTLICSDCNVADGRVKTRLGLPENFSFSPREIEKFVRCEPHSSRCKINYALAQQIYNSVSEEFAWLSSKPAVHNGAMVYDPVDPE